MYITLTNATTGFEGEQIIINTNFILTAYSKQVERSPGQLEQVTFIHCPPHGTWEVQETLDQVKSLLQSNE